MEEGEKEDRRRRGRIKQKKGRQKKRKRDYRVEEEYKDVEEVEKVKEKGEEEGNRVLKREYERLGRVIKQ